MRLGCFTVPVMNIRKLLVGLGLCGFMLLLSSCVSVGTKFETPSDEVLVLRKLTPVEAFKHFGQPYMKETKATKDGTFLTYKYLFQQNKFGTVSSRVLLLEFKENSLNGFFWWSSFSDDCTKVFMDCVEKLNSGVGKLGKDDVLALAGKPSGKAFCPSLLSDFKEGCEKNTEIWGWYMQEQYRVNDQKTPKSQQLTVTFDADGKVSSVQLTEVDNLKASSF